MEEVEAQAQQASQAYLQANPDVEFIYSYILVGTRARVWECGNRGSTWNCLHGDPSAEAAIYHYIDAHSFQAGTLSQLFQMAISNPPLRYDNISLQTTPIAHKHDRNQPALPAQLVAQQNSAGFPGQAD